MVDMKNMTENMYFYATFQSDSYLSQCWGSQYSQCWPGDYAVDPNCCWPANPGYQSAGCCRLAAVSLITVVAHSICLKSSVKYFFLSVKTLHNVVSLASGIDSGPQ